MSIYHFNVSTRTGDLVPLHRYQGRVLLIVNTASKCALTYQFEGLQKLYREYSKYGLEVLGFPCNQFAHQDPADSNTIAAYCQKNYGVSFPVFKKICVNGREAHPLYTYLKNQARGRLWSKSIKWNFTKFLIDHEGRVIARFSPTTKPEALRQKIEQALKLRAHALNDYHQSGGQAG